MEKYKNYKTSEGDKQAGSESDASLCSDVSRTASKSGGRSRGAKKRRMTKSISSSDNEAFLKETNSETGKEVTTLMDNSGEFVVPGPEEALSMAERQVEQMVCAANQKRTALGLPNLVGDDNRSALALNQQVLDDILALLASVSNLCSTDKRPLELAF
ncbi:unnamed protein product [Parnassius apollo]|uniref:(apollo) hypothetical protein n=1 Tax=Parnassius apollo TaxID=110799 RepID=A0A8S3XYE3_PARAO|nr:unnamed protein product [Parnassius apollo]